MPGLGFRGALLWLLILSLPGCASMRTAPAVTSASTPRQTLPIPDDLRIDVERVQALGSAMYVQDSAAAIATDELIRHLGSLRDKNLGGWITLRGTNAAAQQSDFWSVQFYDDGPERVILYEVEVPAEARGSTRFRTLEPPDPPGRMADLLIRAREAAIAAIPAPTRPMNAVLLPGRPFGTEAILVYLLAASTDAEVMTLGKHYRVMVALDGMTILQIDALTNNDLDVPLRRGDGDDRIVAPFVRHVLTDWPSEGYVFASLLHHRPIMVGTARGVWWVDGARVELIASEVPERPSELLQ